MDSDEDSYSSEEEVKKRKKKKSKKSSSGDNLRNSKVHTYVEEEDVQPAKKKKKKKAKEPEPVVVSEDEEEDSDSDQDSTPPPTPKKTPKKEPKTPQKTKANNLKELPVPSTSKGISESQKSSASGAKTKTKGKTSKTATDKDKPATATPASSNTQEDEKKLRFDGMKILTNMSQDDITELLNRIDLQCPMGDTKRDKAREALINWDDVAFANYGPVQCKSIWMFLRAQARTFRIMHEIVDEVKFTFKSDYNKFMKKVIESAPDFPKQPTAMSGFQLYLRQLWDGYKSLQTKMNAKVENFVTFQTKCHQDWMSLPKEQKEQYDKQAKLVVAEYRKKVKEYYANFPVFTSMSNEENAVNKKGKSEKPLMTNVFKKRALEISNEMHADAPKLPSTPLQLFVNKKLNLLDPPPTQDVIPGLKAHYVEKWKGLPDSKKLKWIRNCIKKSEKYIEEVREYKTTHPYYFLPKEFKISRLISKEEFNIWANAHGQPPKPAKTSFDVFLEEFRNSEDAVGSEDEIRRQATSKWEGLDWYHKEEYRMKFKMQQMTFKRDFENYYNELPHLMKERAVETLPKKFRKPFLEDVEKTPLVLANEEPVAVGAGSIEKRKHPALTNDETSQDEGHVESDGHSPKKKKKRKKETEENFEEELAKVASTMETPSSKNIPLYMTQITDAHKKVMDQKFGEKKGSVKTANKKQENVQDDDEEEEEEEVVGKKHNKKRHSSLYPGKNITQSMMGDAIRGIFDGRQLQRKFSPYYYYAKYVIQDQSWVSIFYSSGIMQTASQIIETFNRLNKRQQKIFINEAREFHKVRNYSSTSAQGRLKADLRCPKIKYFPEEPKPPPRNAEALYRLEMKSQRLVREDLFTPWGKLDDQTQMNYLKKLYRVNRQYVIEYEKFVRHMTPNDLVEYLVSRCIEWEISRKRYPPVTEKQKLAAASRDFFASETFRAELSDDGQESEPELYRMDGSLAVFNSTTFRYKKNPFGEKTSQVNKYVKKKSKAILRKKRSVLERRQKSLPEQEVVDSDLPSSSDDESSEELCGLGMKKQEYLKLKQFRAKVREMQRYYYPLEEYYDFSEPTDLLYPCSCKTKAKPKDAKKAKILSGDDTKKSGKPKVKSYRPIKSKSKTRKKRTSKIKSDALVKSAKLRMKARQVKEIPRAKVVLPKMISEINTEDNQEKSESGSSYPENKKRDSSIQHFSTSDAPVEMEQDRTPALILVSSPPRTLSDVELSPERSQTVSSNRHIKQQKEQNLEKEDVNNSIQEDDLEPEPQYKELITSDIPSPELFPVETFTEDEVDPYSAMYMENQFSTGELDEFNFPY